MSKDKIKKLEEQIYNLTAELNGLRQDIAPTPVKNYTFDTYDGKVSLLDMFAGKDKLLVVHNMGQGVAIARFGGDGFNPFLPHLESALSVVMVSKDAPDIQQRFASSRGWRFRMASHGGGDYISEQSVTTGMQNYPGAVSYERDGDKIFRKNAAAFGPGDVYCSVWGLLALAGLGEEQWTPQYNYWQRPQKLDDGGENIID